MSNPIPEDAVAALAAKHRFPPRYDLADSLAKTADRYELHRQLHQPSWARRRKAAEQALGAAAALEAAIGELDREGGGYMADNELRAGLVKLRDYAEGAVAKLGGKRGGKPPDLARRFLVTDLFRVFRSGTGKESRYTFSDYTGQYSGPFVEFAQDAAHLIGADLSPRFIAGVLRETLSK
jgi:hypothetical protein